jgi:hypothetical protein
VAPPDSDHGFDYGERPEQVFEYLCNEYSVDRPAFLAPALDANIHCMPHWRKCEAEREDLARQW